MSLDAKTRRGSEDKLGTLPASRLLNIREVASRLNVSTATVYSLVEQAAIAHLRISNSIKFTPEAVIKFIRRQERRKA